MHKQMVMMAVASLALATPAAAQWDQGNRGWQQAGWDEPRWDDGRRWDGRDDRDGGWDDGRNCRRSRGSTGTVVGAVAGGVLGNQVAGRGDRTLGTVLGAVAGGLLGRSIDRGRQVCR